MRCYELVLGICCLRVSNRDTRLFTGFCFLYIRNGGGTRIRLNQRGFTGGRESCSELLRGVICRHFAKLQFETLICIASSVDRKKMS